MEALSHVGVDRSRTWVLTRTASGLRLKHDQELWEQRRKHDTLIASIKQRLWPMGNDTVFIPGHGPTSTFGRERKTNAFVSDYALS